MSRRTVTAEFGPDVGFEPLPSNSAALFRAEQENRFEALKRNLLNERLSDVWETDANSGVRRAANEAASLAWTTPYPLLAFPELFEEKVRTFLAHAERQTQITRRSRELLAV